MASTRGMPSGAGRHARALWRAAHAMARRMMRPGQRHGSGDLYATFLVAGHRRFGDAAMPVVRAAAGAALARLHVSRAATGTRAELARQGMLSRAVRLDPAPYGGWTWAWTHDALGSPNTARGLRVQRAAGMREARAARREVARAMAVYRRALEAGRYFTITDAGRAALAGAR